MIWKMEGHIRSSRLQKSWMHETISLLFAIVLVSTWSRVGDCVTVKSVEPPSIQRTTAKMLDITVENLASQLHDDLRCVFTITERESIAFTTQASLLSEDGTHLQCPTPPISVLPPPLPGQHYIPSTLSLRQRNGTLLASTEFTFFDCSRYSSCTQCALSEFPCVWCVEGHRCTDDDSVYCRNDIIITNNNHKVPSLRRGPSFCPSIVSSDRLSSEILIPSGTKKMIQVKVTNVMQLMLMTRLNCRYLIEGRSWTTSAQILGDTVYCDRFEFSYHQKSPKIRGSIEVIWGERRPLDNPKDVHVTLYKCQYMAYDCGSCLALPEKYGCGWCQNSSRCQLRDHCESEVSTDNGKRGFWLDRNQICSDAEIIWIHPTSGPLEGATDITIKGINLGHSFEDIAKGVSIVQQADENENRIPCIPYQDQYVQSSRIVCRVSKPSLDRLAESISGSIEVKLENKYIIRSMQHFYFVHPRLLSLSPKRGPKSGGTLLEIRGIHLDAGNFIEAFIGEEPCTIVRRNFRVIECQTPPSSSNVNRKLRVKMDDTWLELDDQEYSYVNDPVILSVEADDESHTQLGVISSPVRGGVKIIVQGENLDLVEYPQIYVVAKDERISRHCHVKNTNTMICRSPAVPATLFDFQNQNPVELDYGFNLGKISSVDNLNQKLGFPKFLLYPDHIFSSKFPNTDTRSMKTKDQRTSRIVDTLKYGSLIGAGIVGFVVYFGF